MNKLTKTVFGVVGFAVLVLAQSSFYVLDQTKQALVLQFGKPMRVVKEPGLKFKTPFLENVIFFDKRLLGITVDQKEVISLDRKRLVVDAYVRYQITDPLRFYQTVSDEHMLENRTRSIVESSMRQVLANVPFGALISADRSKIMNNITAIVSAQTMGKAVPKPITAAQVKSLQIVAPAESVIQPDENVPAPTPVDVVAKVPDAAPAGGFGVEVVDVRIMRADLPPKNSDSIFRRMQTEREREAKEERSKGEEDALGIRAKADRTRTEILSEAQKKAEITRGEGDSEASQIFAESFGRDPQFYSFYRSMQAYRNSISKSDTTILLSPDSEFLRYMNKE